MNHYMPGNIIRLQGNFTDTGGAAADPSARIIVISKPDGTEYTAVTPTLSNGDTGEWYYDFTIPFTSDAKVGAWTYMIRGSETVIAANQEQFYIDKCIAAGN